MANKIWLGLSTPGDLNVSANWSPSGVPAAGDNVTFPAGGPAITASVTALNNSTLSGALGRVVFELGFSGAVGTSTGYMQFSAGSFQFAGSGTSYIDLEASAISPQIVTTGSAAIGFRGLYLKGSALTTVSVAGGSVGIAVQNGETSTVTKLSIVNMAADVWVGSGVTLATVEQTAGKSEIRCAATTINVYGGTLYTKELGAVTTLNVYGGSIYPESTGTITTHTNYGGATSYVTSGQPRTVTTMKLNGGTVSFDPSILTITNRSVPDYAVTVSTSRPAA